MFLRYSLIVSFSPMQLSFSMYLSSKAHAILFGIIINITSASSDLGVVVGAGFLGLGDGCY